MCLRIHVLVACLPVGSHAEAEPEILCRRLGPVQNNWVRLRACWVQLHKLQSCFVSALLNMIWLIFYIWYCNSWLRLVAAWMILGPDAVAGNSICSIRHSYVYKLNSNPLAGARWSLRLQTPTTRKSWELWNHGEVQMQLAAKTLESVMCHAKDQASLRECPERKSHYIDL